MWTQKKVLLMLAAFLCLHHKWELMEEKIRDKEALWVRKKLALMWMVVCARHSFNQKWNFPLLYNNTILTLFTPMTHMFLCLYEIYQTYFLDFTRDNISTIQFLCKKGMYAKIMKCAKNDWNDFFDSFWLFYKFYLK
jgi:hypothetical protein